MQHSKHYNFNFGWKFHEGEPVETRTKDAGFDIGNSVLMTKWTKATSFEVALSDYPDEDWTSVTLPHDFIIEKSVFTNKVPFQTGSLDKSYGWYRKNFTLPADCTENRIFLQCNGIYRDSQVWVNGDIIHRQLGGFMGFRTEITEAANYGEESAVAIFCDPRETEGWWYTGGGIYRDVTLEILPKLCFAHDSVFIKTAAVDLATNHCDFAVSFTVDNGSNETTDFTCEVAFYDGANGKRTGAPLATATQTGTVPNFETADFAMNLSLDNAKLWSPEEPHLYYAVVTLTSQFGTETREIRFAPKKITYDASTGMTLNGKPYFVQGACGHDDFAGVGVAMNRSVIAYKIQTLKNMGVNGYRCAHNPPDPVFLDLCDEMGMLVMDENRWPGVSDIAMDLFVDMIKRDRNHASVFSWSFGNEEASLQGQDKGLRVLGKMRDIGMKLDDSHIYLLAINSNYHDAIQKHEEMGLHFDVNGVNYLMLRDFDSPKRMHKSFPDMCFFNTEISSVYNTRVYKMHNENRLDKVSKMNSLTALWMNEDNRGNVTCYGDSHPKWGHNAEEALKAFEGQKHMCGMFLWTGIDYRGETSPYKFPNVISSYGFIDYCGFFKPWANYLKSYWKDEKFISIMPLSWNLFEKEGTPIQVYAMANCTEIELFLNGRSLGKQMKQPLDRGYWLVPYEKGTLTAVSYENGVEIAQTSLVTAGAVAKLELSTEKTVLIADGADSSIVVVRALDADGNEVTDARNLVHFTLEGDGAIIGTGNGNHMSLEHDKLPQRLLHGGRAIAIVQSKFSKGALTLTATSDGVTSDSITLNVAETTLPLELM